MTTRTIEQIDSEIATVRATTEVVFASLTQEKILVEALDACKNDKERQAVENIGPSFIDQYFTTLEKFTDCACTNTQGFKRNFFYVILQSVGIRTMEYYIHDEEERILDNLIVGKRSGSGWCCYYREELVRVYCLIKNDPSIIERVREQLKQQETVSQE